MTTLAVLLVWHLYLRWALAPLQAPVQPLSCAPEPQPVGLDLAFFSIVQGLFPPAFEAGATALLMLNDDDTVPTACLPG